MNEKINSGYWHFRRLIISVLVKSEIMFSKVFFNPFSISLLYSLKTENNRFQKR